jgi:two-component system, OmpR family, response regulator
VQLQAFVIEDNPTIRENLIGTLEELTCVKVAGASSTEDDALDWLTQNIDRWDLVIVDLFLKQGSGMHLAQRIERRRATQKIVVFSNYINASVRKRCAQIGVDAVFDKSTEIDALVDYCAHQCFRISQAQLAELGIVQFRGHAPPFRARRAASPAAQDSPDSRRDVRVNR